MDEKQHRHVNKAAETFAESLTEGYRAVAGRLVSAQELNAQLTQEFFNGVINNLRTQAESNRALAEDLIEQQRKQQEASQALTQESVNAYMDFLNSVFALPRETAKTAGDAEQDAGPGRSAEAGGEEGPTQDEAVRHPLSSWMETSSDTPVASPMEGVAPEAASLPGEGQTAREEPPPGEERPEKRRSRGRRSRPTQREEPPPGEERPGRRTP
jgi:hypothetical protein